MRRKAREAALRALFQIDVGRASPEAAVRYNSDALGLAPEAGRFASRLVYGTLERLDEIDGRIARFAVDWSLDRMAKTDRNVLRIAIFELLFDADTPTSVVANEAVELAKTYGDADSGRFVNGILGQLLRQAAPDK